MFTAGANMRGFGPRLGYFLGVAGTVGILVAPLSAAGAGTDGDTVELALDNPAAVQQFLAPLQPGRDRPLPDAGPPPNLDFTIQAPRRSPVPRAVEELVFDVRDIKVDGVTTYSPDEIRPLVQPVIGGKAHLSDLLAAAERIEAKYHADGYILTRAFVPTQSVSDGVFRISVIEGYVAAVSVNGGDDSAQARVQQLLAPVLASRPLRLPVIETALLTANQIPGAAVSGLLRPSASEPGASDLVVTVKTAPWAASLSTDNRGAESTGKWTYAADLAVRSPWADGGQLLVNASTATDPNQRRALQAKYVVPVGGDGMLFTMSGLTSHGEPVASLASTPLKIISDSVAVGPHLSYPLLLTRQEKLSVDGGITYQSANVGMLDAPYSHDEWRVADVALTYQNAGLLDGVSTAMLDLAQGLPIFGASPSGSLTISRPGGRTDFTKLTSTVSHVRSIDGPLSLSVSGMGQYADSTLLTGEEVSFGGTAIGRGYDPAAITGDLGVGGSVELRYDLDAADFYANSAQLYSFYDVAAVWVHSGTLSTPNRIQSAGAGVRTVVVSAVSLGLEFAHALEPVPGSDDGHRSSRVFFNGSVRF